MVSRIPLHLRSCHPCGYHYLKKTQQNPLGLDWCSKFNEQIRTNRAKAGCLGFSVEKQIRAIGGLLDAPEGRNITRQVFTDNSDGVLETIESYQDDILLFTITFSFENGKMTLVREDAKELEVGKEEEK